MKLVTWLNIAGVRFGIGAEAPVVCADEDADAYAPFLNVGGEVIQDVSVTITLSETDGPQAACWRPVFECQSWTLSADGDQRWITRLSGDGRPPLWHARVGPGFDDVAIDCSLQAWRRNGTDRCLVSPVCYPLDQILTMYILSRRGGALIHSCGVMIGNSGVLLPGVSGAGKSTLAGLVLAREARRNQGEVPPGDRLQVPSDDRIVIRKCGSSYRLFGTPWPGEKRCAVNVGADLCAIMFLAKASVNELTPLSTREALERMLPVTSIPWYEPDLFPHVLSTCEDLVSRTPVYQLSFRPELDAVDVVERLVLSVRAKC